MQKMKIDMSKKCGFKYYEYRKLKSENALSQDEWNNWYNNNCGKCKYMCEICMYGEDQLNMKICVTGHRPNKLYGYNLSDTDNGEYSHRLRL